MKVSSPAFGENESIPSQFTCDGLNVNPQLNIDQIPSNAKTLAVIVDDPDAPGGDFVHWVAWNLPVASQIKEHSRSGAEGINDFGKNNYGGPCPPKGTHHYHFKVYALDDKLSLPMNSGKAELEDAMQGHVLAFGELTGLYRRNKAM
jgi:Raf kinase inhibitor-like YbhB/YbcL family protein